MSLIKIAIEFFLHIDKNLAILITQFGGWSYVILWVVVFMETGLVVTPFLPGDSLLFAAGALAAMGSFNIWLLYLLMVIAAIVGDAVNYSIGHFIGAKAFNSKNKLLKKEYLEKAQAFYDKHGGMAITLARFVPIVRTFAPFVAGIGKMKYNHFAFYNVIGGIAWVTLFLWGGYFFGNVPFVKENFHYVVVAIVLISVVPIVVEWGKGRKR
jgi:membrane-associated protein